MKINGCAAVNRARVCYAEDNSNIYTVEFSLFVSVDSLHIFFFNLYLKYTYFIYNSVTFLSESMLNGTLVLLFKLQSRSFFTLKVIFRTLFIVPSGTFSVPNNLKCL